MNSSSVSLPNPLFEEVIHIDDIGNLNDTEPELSPHISTMSDEFLQPSMSTLSENRDQTEQTDVNNIDISPLCAEKHETSSVTSKKVVSRNGLPTAEPIKLKMYSKFAKIDDSFDVGNSIVLVDTRIDANVQTEDSTSYRPSPHDNPLITAGIVSEDLAEIFTPPNEKIPQGRKRPLRIKSKARIMTSQEVVADLQNQQQQIDNTNRRREVAGQNISRKSCGTRQGRAIQVRRTSKRAAARKTNHVRNEEDNDCYVCTANFYWESQINKEKWVGCESEECPHWVCPRCVPPDFDYADDYFCNACA